MADRLRRLARIVPPFEIDESNEQRASVWPMKRLITALVLAMIALNALVAVGGRTRVPSAPTLSTGGLLSMLPYGYLHKAPADSIENDMGGAFNASYNYDRYLGASLRSGILPLWDPHLGFGMPHLGNGLSGVLYPLNWLHALIPGRYADFILFANWGLSAIFLMLYLQQLGVAGHAPLFGGLMIACCGWFSGWLGLREITGVAAWFPLLLYAIERTVAQPDWRWRHVLLGLGTYCTITAGHPEAFIPSFLVLSSYGVFRVLQYGKQRFRRLGNLAVGGGAGVFLAAPMWLTFIETISYSHNPHETLAIAAGYLSVNPIGFAGYVFPMLFGNIHEASFGAITGNEYTSPGWLPPCAGFFMLCGLLAQRRGITIFFSIVFALVAFKIWKVPGIQLIATLPGFSEVIWPRYGAYLLAFSAAIVSTFGYEHLRRSSHGFKRALIVWTLFILALAVLCCVELLHSRIPQRNYAFATLAIGVIFALAPPFVIADLKRRETECWKITFVAISGLLLPAVAYNTGGFIWRDAMYLSAIYVALLLLFLLFIRLRSTRSASLILTALAIAATCPILAYARSSGGGPPHRNDVLALPPYLQALSSLQRGGLYRTISFDAAPMPNVQSALGLPGLGWIVPLVPNNFRIFYERFFDANLPSPNWYATNISGRRGPRTSVEELHRNIPNFSMAAVRYVTTQFTPVMTASNAALKEIEYFGSSTTKILENDSAQARLFHVTNVHPVSDAEAAWAAFETFEDPRRQIAIEGDVPSIPECPTTPLEIKTFEVQPNSVSSIIEASCAGVLVLSDLHLPGWHVTLNGAEQRLYRVNGIFRGVHLPQSGMYNVLFWYRPLTWPVALFLAIFAVSGLTLTLLFEVVREKRTKST